MSHRPSQPLAVSRAPMLCSVVYRSRAVAPLSDYDLYELVQTAQARNAAEQITGLMLYDQGRFYQWLEGPAENVARLMRAIVLDRRHTDVEILVDKAIPARQFGEWRMRLATTGVRSIRSVHNVVVPTTKSLAEIHANPENVAEVLAGFAPHPLPVAGNQLHGRSNLPLHGAAGEVLRNVIVTAVLPELVARHAGAAAYRPWPIDSRAQALADLLIGPDEAAVVDLLRSLRDRDGSVRHLYETLVEPAARVLGNLWAQDLCSEFDVTVGLGQLQRALRSLNEDDLPPLHASDVFLPAVLIAPEPGEIHALNAVLDSDALWHAGWDPASEYPASDEALQDLMAGTWFDALDLSLSSAFRREHWLPKVTKTIAAARHASQNPALVVVVGGRIFVEDQEAGLLVGADGVSPTAMHAEQAIRAGLRKVKPAG